ncbi:hypothetical protein TREMEDRAFT_64718 [Tremella mesenterica DSM 1558]|uniref:uncharacterized protein n=1 Tax=Tremella mesenterica (strain ATCC 24925 / CBS 8224 / DSM 1558 / NBRC 9311 / NRRL Y-6157 / RJB 2259-6 / UBC 559-6) TaxID=578456 RepID=UPI0003F496F2|nr:uncharacterized protein TREMEDRAFT_64718 [Tremella mesenterica DSM 1558]EIW66864.1 hypothetical protein TREMEDRAFT_64718 [Tremella mesenterica DSM 1558]
MTPHRAPVEDHRVCRVCLARLLHSEDVSHFYPSHENPSSRSGASSRLRETSAAPSRAKTSKTSQSRIVRTFEEVTNVVPTEELYDEMECSICSHVLGCPQTIVPCGHSFCGPCAWEWIKLHENYTCPQCRAEVYREYPYIPNIVLDQIIERKLRSLRPGKQKDDYLAEREAKLK